MIDLRCGDALDVLRTLPDGIARCCITSPPYFGLRDYGTARWEGGDPDCSHFVRPSVKVARSTLGGGTATQGHQREGFPGRCHRCGAKRIDRQIGLEGSIEAYVARLVEVFREVRRVLADDGTLWLNLGSSFSTGTTNLADCFNRLLEGGSVFFADADAVTATSHCVRVAAQNQRTPNRVLDRFLAPQGGDVEYRHQDLGKIGYPLHDPCRTRTRTSVCSMVADASDSEQIANEAEHGRIVMPNSDAETEPELVVLRTPRARTSENDETPLSIDEPNEPCGCNSVRWQTRWDAFAGYAVGKGTVNIDFVNQTVALGDRLNAIAGLLRDFRVSQASEQKLSLTSVCGRLKLTVTDVRHLWFSLRDSSIVPYGELYQRAIRRTNELRGKQDLGIPWRVARALQQDGWFLRAPIIWHKPNPMPESVRDRPTKSHEYLFLLAKRPRYFYDAEAITEPTICAGRIRKVTENSGSYRQAIGSGRKPSGNGKLGSQIVIKPTRNRRDVWTIATKPCKAAHFAVMPDTLVEPCILAGSAAGDTVLDPFVGAGTVPMVAARHGRHAIGIDLNPAYLDIARDRIAAAISPAETKSRRRQPIPA